MLDTAFPRPLGDAGNPASYPLPVRIVRVPAGVAQVVRDAPPLSGMEAALLGAARELRAAGAVGLVSTCGFLVTSQARLAAAAGLPVMLSALSLWPLLRTMHAPGAAVGILTASRPALGPAALAAAGIAPAEAAIAGMEDCPAFAGPILHGAPVDRLDAAAIAEAAADRAAALVAGRSEIAAILLECANLPPCAARIAQAARRPVYTILDAAALIWSGAHRA